MLPTRSLFLLLLTMMVSSSLAQGVQYKVGVDGLSCPFCAYGVEKQLHKLKGVDNVATEIAQGFVVVSMEEGKTLDKKQAQGSRKSGFQFALLRTDQGVKNPVRCICIQRAAAIGLLVISTGIPRLAGAAPITFSTALPVAEDEFIFRQQFRWVRSSGDPGEADRDMSAVAAISVLGYGVNHKLAIFGAIPYVDKTLEINSAGTGIERHNKGLGDATVFARYTFW